MFRSITSVCPCSPFVTMAAANAVENCPLTQPFLRGFLPAGQWPVNLFPCSWQPGADGYANLFTETLSPLPEFAGCSWVLRSTHTMYSQQLDNYSIFSKPVFQTKPISHLGKRFHVYQIFLQQINQTIVHMKICVPKPNKLYAHSEVHVGEGIICQWFLCCEHPLSTSSLYSSYGFASRVWSRAPAIIYQ